MAIQQLHNGSPDGALLGQATTDLVGFYGLTTPIAQPTITLIGTTTATTALNETAISRIHAALVALNIVNTGG